MVVVGVVVIIVVVTIYVSSSNKTKVQLCITQLSYNTNKNRSVCPASSWYLSLTAVVIVLKIFLFNLLPSSKQKTCN